jgi:histidyl-tRNA synthetase
LELAADLRSQGLSVDVFPDQAKIKNQFKFASESGYRWVLIVGEDEWNSKLFKLKDFLSGVEIQVPLEQVGAHLKGLIAK